MRFRTLLAPALAVLFMAGCDGLADLEVENLNDPDAERALADPGDVVSLIGSGFLQWWNGGYKFAGAPALSVAADAHSASWGNFGMQDIGTEPRIALNNNPSYGYSYMIEGPWEDYYAAIKAASDGLRAIEGLGGEPVDVGADDALARSFARFVQGISHGQLALMYDQAFIFDETIGPDEIDAGLELVPYADVMAAAVGYLEDAASIASGADFVVPDTWMPGANVDSETLAQLAHSYAARYMASVARSPSEADDVANGGLVDWGAVISHAQAGITEPFGPMGQLTGPWWDVSKSYSGVFPGWGRLDLRFLGMADNSGSYQDWLALPPADRNAFLITTADGRVTAGPGDTDGAYVQYYSTIPFRPERGTYFFSNYGDMRWAPDWECDGDVDPCDPAWYGPYGATFATRMVAFHPTELTMLEAEANYWLENYQDAADLINTTRSDWLPGVAADGVPDAVDCVPMEPSSTAECGDLLTALHWEKWLETYHTGPGVHFADARRWGFLVSGTPLHFPMPGAELQILGLPIYTFGADQGAPGQDVAQ